jgi:hypothetical protein
VRSAADRDVDQLVRVAASVEQDRIDRDLVEGNGPRRSRQRLVAAHEAAVGLPDEDQDATWSAGNGEAFVGSARAEIDVLLERLRAIEAFEIHPPHAPVDRLSIGIQQSAAHRSHRRQRHR